MAAEFKELGFANAGARRYAGRDLFVSQNRFTPEDNGGADAVEAEQFGLHFRWVHLFSGHVNHIGDAADDTETVTASVHEVVRRKKTAVEFLGVRLGKIAVTCRRALDALKNTSIECPRVTVDFIHKMAGWYVDFLNNRPQMT